MTTTLEKHHRGKHNQKNHGRRTAARQAYHDGYRESRASGLGHAESREAAKIRAKAAKNGAAAAAPSVAPAAPPPPTMPAGREFANGREADKEMIRTSAIRESDLDYFTQSAFQHYQHEGYKPINNGLRTGDKKLLKENQREIALMDKTMARSRLTQPVIVHRGLVSTPGTPSADLLASWEPGREFREMGYMSTTVDKARVDKFVKSTGRKTKGSTQVNVRVHAPAGTSALYMNAAVQQRGITNYREERELLINRGQRYRVISKTVNPNGTVDVDLEIIP